MFTGLIQSVGRLVEVRPTPEGLRVVVTPGESSFLADPAPLSLGESISVSGTCLTLCAIEGDRMAFDVIPETIARTSAARWTEAGVGARVNLERSVTPTTLLGGHLVQGHVDGVGSVLSIQTEGEWRVRIAPPLRTADGYRFMEWVVPKGSITLEGVSLTVAGLDIGSESEAGWFEVALVPTTLEKTTLAELRPSDAVNLEADVSAKTLVHWARNFGSGSTGPR